MEPETTRRGAREAGAFGGSVSALRLFGIPIRLHFTFILLFVFLIVSSTADKESGFGSVIYIAALFASVALHEVGHALLARRAGIRTLEIVLFPIGGVSRLERDPKPREELWIAAAGPLVNFLIAAVLIALLAWRRAILPLSALAQPTDANLLQRIAAGNLILAVFNLLPAFPMDGGRILRSVLALKRPPDEATRLASRAGQFLAIAMGLYGLLTADYILVFIAFFVYLGAAQEGAAATGRILTHGTPVRAAMVTDFRTLSHGDTIRDAANLLLATTQQDFPVMHGDQVIGLLTRSALVRAMAASGPDAYVAGVMDRDFVVLSPGQDLAEAMQAMTKAGSCALVMEGGRLAGLITAENLSEFLLLRKFGMPADLRNP